MTFKMLIVDDEPLIRRGLEKTIPWEQHNIEIAGLACDGEEAIRKITSCPDIELVITDVRMPNRDGLQLAEYLAAHHPGVRIIMISGYDEFAYAQQAIRLGVKNYLLKPVDIDELLEVVREVTDELQAEQRKTKNFFRINLRNFIYHQVFDQPVKLTEVSFAVRNLLVFPVISMLSDYAYFKDSLSEQQLNEIKDDWKTAVEEDLRKAGLTGVSLFTSDNILLTCIVSEDNNQMGKIDFRQKLKLDAEQGFSLSFIHYGANVPAGQLKQAYHQLTRHIKFLPLQPNGKIPSVEEELDSSPRPGPPLNLENALEDAVLRLALLEVKEQLDQLFTYFEANNFFLEEVTARCREITSRIIRRIEALQKHTSPSVPTFFQQEVHLEIHNSYRSLRQHLEQDIQHIIEYYSLEEVDQKDWVIERAEEYIRSYYTSEIRAQEVADVVNISPNYFSSLFKQKTGKNFTEYINELRIEHAKKLLEETPFKVSEIAEQAGFHEYKYFIEIFKKYAGATPTTYRKMRTISSK